MRAIRPADQNEASIGITPMCLLLLAFITQLTGCGQAPEGTISDLQGCQAAADCIRDVPEQEQEQEQEPAPEPNPEPETAPDTPPVNPCPRCEPVELDCDYDQANVHFHDPIQLESDSLPAGARANDIIVDFIDGDAHRDIAVFYSVPGKPDAGVAVFSGDGRGGFSLESQQAIDGHRPMRAQAVDLNGDGILDFAVYCVDTPQLEIVLRSATGFSHSGSYPIQGSSILGVAGTLTPLSAGDVDGDGDVDLVVVTDESDPGQGVTRFTQLFSNRGDGSFDVDDLTLEMTRSFDLVLADFNGDQKIDLASIDGYQMITEVFFGDGRGGFDLKASLPFGIADSPEMIMAGDYDCDGDTDIRTLHESCYDAYYENNGDGTFQDTEVFMTMKDPTTREASGDFNGDGNQDLVIVGYNMDMTFLLLDDNGSVQAETSTLDNGIELDFGTAVQPWDFNTLQVATGDLDHDCIADVVVGLKESDRFTGWGEEPPEPDSPVILNILLANPCDDPPPEDDYQ